MKEPAMSTLSVVTTGTLEPVELAAPSKLKLRRRIRKRLASWAMRVLHRELYSHESALRLAAMAEGAEYAAQHMRDAVPFSDEHEVLLAGVNLAPRNGLFLEVGVWSGQTINLTAGRVDKTVHGFDSFEGLPEDWRDDYKKGAFHMRGKLPSVRPNVRLHVGWFKDTLPKFIAEHEGSIAFLHVDCDLYSSTKTVFEFLGTRLRTGSVIVFDEYFNYPGWRKHEYLAFQEIVRERSLRYRYLAYNAAGTNVAVQITG